MCEWQQQKRGPDPLYLILNDRIAATFFRKLGFVPCYGKDDSIDTLMVRSDAKNRTVMFNIGEAEMATQGVSRYMNAQLMWQASE